MEVELEKLTTKNFVPLGWAYVYIIKDLKKDKLYLGSHNGKNPKYMGGGIIISRIVQKRPQDLVLTPIFTHPEIKVVRAVEDMFLKKFDCAGSSSYYNLKNDAVGGNTYLNKTRSEVQEISKKCQLKRRETLLKNPEIEQRRVKKQKVSLHNNIEQLRSNIKKTLSLRTIEERRQQQLKLMKSRYLRGISYLIEVFDENNISRGIYFGACVISVLFPITSAGVLVNCESIKRIRQGNLVGWKFVKLPVMSWDLVESYVVKSLDILQEVDKYGNRINIPH